MKDLARLTLEEKAGQLFFLGFQGPKLDSETAEAINRIRPGGFVLYQRNIESFDQIYELNSSLRRMLPVRPFLAVDQEGGKVDRLKHIFAPTPPVAELAGAGLAALRTGARVIAAELGSLGFDVDFAPVLDLALPNSIMTERALSADPRQVARFGGAFVEELAKRNILCCGKHFPGLGGTQLDPHFVLPRIDRTRRQILDEDVAPFRSLLGRLDMMMISHGHYPALSDGRRIPASLSPRIVDRLLRKRLAFQGVILTDDLAMGATASVGLTPDLFLHAVESGNDMVLFSQTTPLVEQALRTIVRALRKSASLRKRVDDSLKRIASLKNHGVIYPIQYRAHLQGRLIRQIQKLRLLVEEPARKMAEAFN